MTQFSKPMSLSFITVYHLMEICGQLVPKSVLILQCGQQILALQFLHVKLETDIFRLYGNQRPNDWVVSGTSSAI